MGERASFNTAALKIAVAAVALVFGASVAVERAERERQLLEIAYECRSIVVLTIDGLAKMRSSLDPHPVATVHCFKDKGNIAIHFFASPDRMSSKQQEHDESGMQCEKLTENLPVYEQKLIRSAVEEPFSSICKPTSPHSDYVEIFSTADLRKLAWARAKVPLQLPKRPLLDQSVIDWIDGQMTAQLTSKCKTAAVEFPKLFIKGQDKADFGSISTQCEFNAKVKLFAYDLANQYGRESKLGDAWKEEITAAFKKVFCDSQIDPNTARTQAAVKKRMESFLTQ